MARMWQSPFVRLAAYYVVLSVAVGLLVKAFPQIVDLFEAFQRLSPIHGTGGRKDALDQDRKSTRLNSSHSQISYAVFCLKKKKKSSRLFTHNRHLSLQRLATQSMLRT